MSNVAEYFMNLITNFDDVPLSGVWFLIVLRADCDLGFLI